MTIIPEMVTPKQLAEEVTDIFERIKASRPAKPASTGTACPIGTSASPSPNPFRASEGAMEKQIYCSFCGKKNTETELMLAGPVCVFICLECVDDAHQQGHEIVATRRDEEQMFAEARRCTFCIPFPISSPLPSQDGRPE